MLDLVHKHKIAILDHTAHSAESGDYRVDAILEPPDTRIQFVVFHTKQSKEVSMSEHAKELEPKIQKIQSRLKKMASENYSERLLQIVRRPGFTTPQEVQFVHAMLDSVDHHLEGIDRARSALTTIADKIDR